MNINLGQLGNPSTSHETPVKRPKEKETVEPNTAESERPVLKSLLETSYQDLFEQFEAFVNVSEY
jgi:hypothetical protein